MSSIKITGLDEIQRKLERLRRNAQELDGTHEVPFTELFPDDFMRRNTQFQTMQQMLDASGIDKPEEIQGEAWSQFVADHSQFSDWQDMQKAAFTEYVRRKLNL